MPLGGIPGLPIFDFSSSTSIASSSGGAGTTDMTSSSTGMALLGSSVATAAVDGLQPFGILILFVFPPIHILSTLVFWKRRHHFPIKGRYPNLTLALSLLMLPVMLFPGYQFWQIQWSVPCWLGWMVWVPLSTAFLPITTIRATLLLCNFEVTTDLENAEMIRAIQRQKYKHQQRQNFMRQNSANNITLTGRTPNDSPTASALPQHHHHPPYYPNGNGGMGMAGSAQNSGLDGNSGHNVEQVLKWRPSWWTLNRRYLRGKLLTRLVMVLILYYVLCDLAVANLVTSATLRCALDSSLRELRDTLLICTSAISAPLCLWLLFVVWNLRRHQRDGYGTMLEFKYLALALLVTLPIGFLITGSTTPAIQTTWRLSLLWGAWFITWAATIMWPIALTYRHEWQLRERLAQITSVTKLSDLLLIPEGYEAFLAFARSEFKLEGVLFWKRVLEFREISSLSPPPAPAAASAATTVTITRRTAAATTNTTTTTTTTHNNDATPLILANDIAVTSVGHGIITATPLLPPPSSVPAADAPGMLMPGEVDGSPKQDSKSISTSTTLSTGTVATVTTTATATVSSPNNPCPPVVVPLHTKRVISANGVALAHTQSFAATGNHVVPLPQRPQCTPLAAQQNLLTSLLEANAIWNFYIDINGPACLRPFELPLNDTLRTQLRATLDNCMMRAATHNNLQMEPRKRPTSPLPSQPVIVATTTPDLVLGATTAAAAAAAASSSSAPKQQHYATPHGHGGMPPASAVISRRGVSVSTALTVEEAQALEIEVRTAFNQCQEVVINCLDINAFQRFRTSDVMMKLVAGLKGYSIDGKPLGGIKKLLPHNFTDYNDLKVLGGANGAVAPAPPQLPPDDRDHDGESPRRVQRPPHGNWNGLASGGAAMMGEASDHKPTASLAFGPPSSHFTKSNLTDGNHAAPVSDEPNGSNGNGNGPNGHASGASHHHPRRGSSTGQHFLSVHNNTHHTQHGHHHGGNRASHNGHNMTESSANNIAGFTNSLISPSEASELEFGDRHPQPSQNGSQHQQPAAASAAAVPYGAPMHRVYQQQLAAANGLNHNTAPYYAPLGNGHTSNVPNTNTNGMHTMAVTVPTTPLSNGTRVLGLGPVIEPPPTPGTPFTANSTPRMSHPAMHHSIVEPDDVMSNGSFNGRPQSRSSLPLAAFDNDEELRQRSPIVQRGSALAFMLQQHKPSNAGVTSNASTASTTSNPTGVAAIAPAPSITVTMVPVKGATTLGPTTAKKGLQKMTSRAV